MERRKQVRTKPLGVWGDKRYSVRWEFLEVGQYQTIQGVDVATMKQARANAERRLSGGRRFRVEREGEGVRVTRYA